MTQKLHICILHFAELQIGSFIEKTLFGNILLNEIKSK